MLPEVGEKPQFRYRLRVRNHVQKSIDSLLAISTMSQTPFVLVDRAALLSHAYTEYYRQRHPLFHMESMVETTKILGSIQYACQIVDSVTQCAETCCQKIARL